MSQKVSLLERILVKLGLTDGDRIKTFLERQVKSLKKDEKNLGKNIDTVTDQKIDALEAISDKIADAEEAVIAAYDAVDIAEKLKMAFMFGKRTEGRNRILELGWSTEKVAEKLLSVYGDILGTKPS